MTSNRLLNTLESKNEKPLTREVEIAELHAHNQKTGDMLSEIIKRRNAFYACHHSKLFFKEWRCVPYKEALDAAIPKDGESKINAELTKSNVLHRKLFPSDDKSENPDKRKSQAARFENCTKKLGILELFYPPEVVYVMQHTQWNHCTQIRDEDIGTPEPKKPHRYRPGTV